jgi:AsmA protein
MKVTAIAAIAILGVLLLFLIVGIPVAPLVGTIANWVAAQTGEKLEVSGGGKLRLFPTPVLVLRDVKVSKDGDADGAPKLTIKSVQLTASLASLLRGKPEISRIEIENPVVRVPLVRRADGPAKDESMASGDDKYALPDIEQVIVTDGSVLLVRPGGQVNDRFDHINIAASLSRPDHRADVKLKAELGRQVLRIRVRSKAPIDTIRRSLPVELTLEAPGLLQGKLSSTMNATASSTRVKITDWRGAIGDDGFSGTASVELSRKPRVNLNLDFKRLSFAAKQASTEPASGSRAVTKADSPWSDAPIDFDNLNFVDARVSLTASELDISRLQLAPAYLEAALTGGVLNVAVSDTGVYGGKANGLFTLNASGDVPHQSMNLGLNGVRASPLLSALADFSSLEGKMRATMDLQASGRSQRAVMSTLDGTIDVDFQDGVIRNVNVANLVRTLTRTTLTGWQKKQAEKTDLNELSALFKVKAGRASTDNLKMLGPLVRVNGSGIADLGARTLQFKLDTKLVLSLKGQGGPADPVGFGVPVTVEGSWSAPRMYPDVTGILDNPGAAYNRLHGLGTGLFGSGFNLFGDDPGASGAASHGDGKAPGGTGEQRPAAKDAQGQTPPTVDGIINDLFGK